jgi:hypothetical protein
MNVLQKGISALASRSGAPVSPRRYSITTACSDESHRDLHARSSRLEATPFRGMNPLWLHGKRNLEHADGTTFFWLGDTWWLGLCQRFRWQQDFQQLAADGSRKGFTEIQSDR